MVTVAHLWGPRSAPDAQTAGRAEVLIRGRALARVQHGFPGLWQSWIGKSTITLLTTCTRTLAPSRDIPTKTTAKTLHRVCIWVDRLSPSTHHRPWAARTRQILPTLLLITCRPGMIWRGLIFTFPRLHRHLYRRSAVTETLWTCAGIGTDTICHSRGWSQRNLTRTSGKDSGQVTLIPRTFIFRFTN